jgi:hypothetical protein
MSYNVYLISCVAPHSVYVTAYIVCIVLHFIAYISRSACCELTRWCLLAGPTGEGGLDDATGGTKGSGGGIQHRQTSNMLQGGQLIHALTLRSHVVMA